MKWMRLRFGDHRAAGRRHRQGGFGRRGNALIMAVSLTTMLAIIGTSFVLVTRIESRSTKNYAETMSLSAVKTRILSSISKQLRDDIVRLETNASDQYVLRFLDATNTSGETIEAASDRELNEPYDAPYYYRLGTDGNRLQGDIWLAPVEPRYDSNNELGWSRVSDPFQDPADLSNDNRENYGVRAERWNSVLPPPVNNSRNGFDVGYDGMSADADGDGITDAIWRKPRTLQVLDGKDVFVAVRMIDNCGLINLNTAWDMYPALTEPFADKNGNNKWDSSEPFFDMNGNGVYDAAVADSYGLLPGQLYLNDLLAKAQRWSTARTTVEENLSLQWLRLGGCPADTYGYGGGYGTNDVVQYMTLMHNYNNWVLRFLESPALLARNLPDINRLPVATQTAIQAAFPKWPAPLDLGKHARPFDMDDERVLRHRYLLKSNATGRLESVTRNIGEDPNGNSIEALWNSIGDDKTLVNNVPRNLRRRAPYQSEQDFADWMAAVTPPLDAAPANSKYDVRHLLTTFSYDRTSYPRKMTLDGVAPSGLNKDPGPFRSVDLNKAVQDIILFSGSGPYAAYAYRANHARLKIVQVLKDAGYDTNEAVQYVANLEDYLDAEYVDTDGIPDVTRSNLTVIAANQLGTGIPAKAIYGTERQPFITEVYVKLKLNAQDKYEIGEFMIELFNPYTQPINLAGWELRYLKGADSYDSIPLSGFEIGKYDPMDEALKPGSGRLILTQSSHSDLLKIPMPPNGDLVLVRPVVAGTAMDTNSSAVVVDRVAESDWDKLRTDISGSNGPDNYEYSLQRGGQYNSNHPYAGENVVGADTWAFARNRFQATGSSSGVNKNTSTSPKLGGPVSQQYGYSISVWNVAIPGKMPPRLSWREALRPMLIGNTTATGATGNTAITDLIAKETSEDKIRISVTSGKGRGVLQHMALIARGDDGWNNDDDGRGGQSNLDLDALAAGLPLPRNREMLNPDDPTKTVPNPDFHADKLSECRIPGRINVNTAPWAVLRTVVPALPMLPGMSVSDYQALADELAAWIVQNRVGKPFTSVSDFASRLNQYQKPAAVAPITGQDVPNYFRFNRWLAVRAAFIAGKASSYTVPSAEFPDFDLGIYALTADYETSTWLLSRMLDKITVRSDTFTAYILVRAVDKENPSEMLDKRYIAIFDRSNVFLPPELAKNVDNPEDPTDWLISKNESGDVLPVEITASFECDPSQNPTPTNNPGCYYGSDPNNPILKTYDPNFRDRKYVEPKLVVLQEVTN